MKDNLSDVTSTGFALQMLSRVLGLSTNGKEAIQHGITWLMKIRNPDNSWGMMDKHKGTIAHTSEAVDGLLASGVDKSSLLATHEWLINNIHEDAQFLERYLISSVKDRSLIWTQVTRARGLIALLRLGSNLTSPEVVNSLRKILENQVNNTFWRTETHPDSEAIWALKEATIGLRLYLDRLERDRTSIAMSEDLATMKSEINILKQQIIRLEDSISSSSLTARISRFLKFLLRPGSLILLMTMGLVIFYIRLKNNIIFPEYSDVFIGIIGIIGFALTIYQFIKPPKT